MQLHALNQQHINSLVTALNLGQQREERRDIGIEKKILQIIHPSYFSDRIHGVHYKQIKSLFSRREECLGHKRGIFWGTLTDCTQSKGLRIITVGKSWYGHFTLLNIWTSNDKNASLMVEITLLFWPDKCDVLLITWTIK